MGYSYRNEAGTALGRIAAEAARLHGEQTSNLVVNAKGQVLGFYEITRKDQKDGGICGTVHKFTNAERTFGKKAGSFKITGEGKVERFPLMAAEVLAKATDPRAPQDRRF